MQDWLRNQKKYQEETYEVDYDAMWRDNQVVEYVTTMLTAAQIEVAEAFQEVPWKPWAKLTPLKRSETLADRDAKITGELVDVMFFIANVLVALEVTDEEFATAYAAKMGVNQQRQADGYDGITTKCTNCKRALDEPGSPVPIDHYNGTFCSRACLNEDAGFTTTRGNTSTYSCGRCGRAIGSFELFAIGLDNNAYCSSHHAIEATGGQLGAGEA